MQQEKDYLQREIERITLFLKTLLRRMSGLKDEGFKPEYDQLEKDLKAQVDFSIKYLEKYSTTELEEKMDSLPLPHLETLFEIAFEAFKKGGGVLRSNPVRPTTNGHAQPY